MRLWSYSVRRFECARALIVAKIQLAEHPMLRNDKRLQLFLGAFGRMLRGWCMEIITMNE